MSCEPQLTQVEPGLWAERAEHFRLYFYAAVLHVIAQAARSYSSLDALLAEFPFLIGYQEALAARGVEDCTAPDASAQWRAMVHAWEERTTSHLPLRALRATAGLDDALTMLMCVGLIEEDARFGLVFEALQTAPGQHRPTVGLLSAWWRGLDDWSDVRTAMRRLETIGLIQVVNPAAPRMEWALQTPAVLWDVMRGDDGLQSGQDHDHAWVRHRPLERLAALDALILPEAARRTLASFAALAADGDVRALVIRGAHRNGRRTALGAIARQLGRGVLEVRGLEPASAEAGEEHWRWIGPLATMLHAMPALSCDLASGETLDVPALEAFDSPIGIALGKHGGLSGAAVEQALTLTLEMPDATARRQHWEDALIQAGSALPSDDEVDKLSRRFRMTIGNVRRTARLSLSYAALAGRTAPTTDDAQQASRALNRQSLETLAEPLPPLSTAPGPPAQAGQASSGWSSLAVSRETLEELRTLERRCRHREQLRAVVGAALGPQLTSGVRALFTGPSGTGKTLAARALGATLGMDVYRLDLASVVNKYIGETEKNLSRVFARAEELDVMLLIDEGDALLTNRTDVQSSNDRYANLETNYLLQRLESYEGILVVTTNANERIDGAFQRRMDVVIPFRAPDAEERRAIWRMHLPAPGAHAIDPALLDEVAVRCALTGGQIRNAALHASTLALGDGDGDGDGDGRAGGATITSAHLEAAVRREYRRLGLVCPLRRVSLAASP